jgi:predicted transcriptional regulator
MLSQTIEIGTEAYNQLLELAETVGEPVQTVLDRAIEEYRRQVFWQQTNQAFAALRNDPELWQKELAERAVWDVTLLDGIES